MKPFLLGLTLPVTAVALLYARWEYRRRGRLGWLSLGLVCLMIFVPNLLLEYATSYQLPRTPLALGGVAIGLLGLAICLPSVWTFRSAPKVLCLDAGELSTSGLYHRSRNPQYVGWYLFLVGFALTDWSWWCLGALTASAVGLHLLVLVEEEHLQRVFGGAYAEFRRRVPRYFGRPSQGGRR